jgi:hypothetical protein
VNRKRVQRIYREERLTVRRRGGRKRAMGMRRPIETPLLPNQRWSLDFVSDQMTDGRRFRILTVTDNCTRECLALVNHYRSFNGRWAERGSPPSAAPFAQTGSTDVGKYLLVQGPSGRVPKLPSLDQLNRRALSSVLSQPNQPITTMTTRRSSASPLPVGLVSP